MCINIYMYSYSQNYENTTMHYYVHFYCLITYNLLHVFSLHIRWLQLHIFLNVTKSRKQMNSSVGVDTSNHHWLRARRSWTREPISYDQPYTYTGNTLSKIILYTCSVSTYTVHSIMIALLQYAIFHIIFDAFIS